MDLPSGAKIKNHKAEFEKQLNPQTTMDHLGLKKLFDAAKNNKDVAARLKEAAVAAHYFDLANELREIERSIPENLNDKQQKDKLDNDKIQLKAQEARNRANTLGIKSIIKQIEVYSQLGDTKMIMIDKPTNQQIAALSELGYVVRPNKFLLFKTGFYTISW